MKERKAMRAILLAPDRTLLLMHARTREGPGFWMTPGGGLEQGESDEQGLRRELREETGLEDFAIGPLLLRRQHVFGSGDKHTRQTEHIYVVHCERFEPVLHDLVEARYISHFRWWTLDELTTTSEQIAPRALAQIVHRYLERGPGAEVEVLDES